MAKNIQFKIVLIFFIIGITIIDWLGIFYINSLNTIQAQIGEVTVNEIQQIINNTRIKYKYSINNFRNCFYYYNNFYCNVSFKICYLSC